MESKAFYRHSLGRSRLDRGFTLVELLVVLAIVAVLFLVASPNYDPIVSGSKVQKQKLEIATSLALARTEAVKRGELVRVCMGAVSNCLAVTDDSGTESWSVGWRVQTVDDGTVLQVQQGIAEGTTLVYTCGKYIEFNAAGERTTSGSTNECQFTTGKDGDASYDSPLKINLSGRVSLK